MNNTHMSNISIYHFCLKWYSSLTMHTNIVQLLSGHGPQEETDQRFNLHAKALTHTSLRLQRECRSLRIRPRGHARQLRLEAKKTGHVHRYCPKIAPSAQMKMIADWQMSGTSTWRLQMSGVRIRNTEYETKVH